MCVCVQVDQVRDVLNNPENADLSDSETFDLVASVLDLGDQNKRRRLLQDADEGNTPEAVKKVSISVCCTAAYAHTVKQQAT